MNKKNKNTLLYAGLGIAAALLLFKKKDNSMEGVGYITSTILIDGDFLLVKEIASYLQNTPYIDIYKYKEAKNGISLTVGYTYSTLKETKNIFQSLINVLQRKYEIKEWKIGKTIQYTVYENDQRANITFFKGGMIH